MEHHDEGNCLHLYLLDLIVSGRGVRGWTDSTQKSLALQEQLRSLRSYFLHVQNVQKCYDVWTLSLWILEAVGPPHTPGFLTRHFSLQGVTLNSGPELVLPFPSSHPHQQGTQSAYSSRRWELLPRVVEK